MNASKATAALRALINNRREVYQFLNFCNHPDQGFAGSVHGEELEFLTELVRNANDIDGPLVEIGTLFGFTTQRIAIAKNDNKELITVDNFRWNPIGLSPNAHRDFTKRALEYACQRGSTRIYEGDNTAFYSEYEGHRPSLVFIDAGHSYEDIMVDLSWATKMDIPIICGHDYADEHPGVMKAVDELFGSKIKVVGSVWANVA